MASTAALMSDSRPPATARLRPCHRARSHVSSRPDWAGVSGPTPTVTAASPCQPPTMAPQSTEIRSPAASRTSGRGMPCTTSSLTEVQIVAGKP